MAVVWYILIAVFSLAAGLAICEAFLRLVHPVYEQLADPPVSPVERLTMQLHQQPGDTYTWQRPDTDVAHAIVYNNLGNRQHRNFSEQDLRDGVNIAFFGDSFTENRYIAAPYSFTEVLDHLLNAQATAAAPREEAPPRINVLNFGMVGTGPDLQYMRYRDLAHKASLSHVFYVHCMNDFDDLRDGFLHTEYVSRDSHRHDFSESEAADFVRARMGMIEEIRARSSTWKRLLSGFHLTYLVLDVWHRLARGDVAGQRGQEQPQGPRAAPTASPPSTPNDAGAAPPSIHAHDADFRALVLHWRDHVEALGGEFHVVLLPLLGTAERFAAAGWPNSLAVLDLHACFNESIPDFHREDWRFKSDPHWNEAGNMVAAHCLYRFLEDKLGLGGVPDETLARSRHVYFKAFADDPSWLGHRWEPSPPWVAPQPVAEADAAGIRARYLALASDPRRQLLRSMRESGPVARAGGWEVYASLAQRQVVYVKSACGEADPASRLFLRTFAPSRTFAPDSGDGGGAGRQGLLEEIRLGKSGEKIVWRIGQECVIARRLDYYPVAEVQTGEYEREHGGPVLWQGTFPFDSAEAVSAATEPFRQDYAALAAGEPHARSRWNVHVSDADIAYLKAPCDADDLDDPFFLGMLPASAGFGDMEHRDADGFVYRGVKFRQLHGDISSDVSATFDGKCLLKLRLPTWPVATITTGQRATEGDSVLWKATFHLDVERFQRAYESASDQPPTAQGVFNVHRVGDELIYIREPCVPNDVRTRFFLHVHPRRHGWLSTSSEDDAEHFVNLDFDFEQHGVYSDGRCVIVRPLPDYDIDRIRTGQFAAGDEGWAVAF